jgi:hypothetical protein
MLEFSQPPAQSLFLPNVHQPHFYSFGQFAYM